MVKCLLAAGANANVAARNDNRRAGLLQTAIEEGWPDVAEILISAGVEVNTKDESGWTPLHAAIIASYRPCVDRVIEREYAGEDFRGSDDWRRRWMLEREISRRFAARVATLLINHHADVNAKHECGATPLHCAARMGLEKVAKLLIEKGADVNARTIRKSESWWYPGYWAYDTDAGVMPLHGAAASGEPNVVGLLLAHGADINAADESGRTPLHYAAESHYYVANSRARVEATRLLIAKGAVVDAKDKKGKTPLAYALESGDVAAAKTLMAAGAQKVVVRSRPGYYMLHDVFDRRDKELLEMLLANGADPNERRGGETLLHLTARQEDEEMARILLNGGAYVNVRSSNGAAALHYAAAGHTGFVSLLLANGADINARANDGDTPLHRAATRGGKDVVELLLAHGADVNAKDNGGRTPLDEAIRRGHKDVIELLAGKAKDSAAKAQGEKAD